MAAAAREWRRSNEEAENLVAGLDERRVHRIRYEDLCLDPEGVLREAASFVGFEPEDVTLDFRGQQKHVVGNGMRLDNTSEITLDDRWKQHLKPDELEVFDSVAGSLNRSFGYE
jgi:hypothetical protein